jgi:hypothetical protein
MLNLKNLSVEAYSRESFQCGSCNKEFETTVVTWIDVSKTPMARSLIAKWQFNIIQCTHCGCRHFSGTPFFYEDFEEGLLVAVFPRIPDQRGEMERSIAQKYGYYPILEYFYDMTQLWMLLYFQEHYKTNKNLRQLSRIGQGEKRLRAMLRFLKENSLMIDIREKLTESFFNESAEEALSEVLGRAVYTLEQMLPWPLDSKCRCGADLNREFSCCGMPINIAKHENFLSKHFVVYCPRCKEALSGASCESCGRVYTWKLGTVPSYQPEKSRRKSPLAIKVSAASDLP